MKKICFLCLILFLFAACMPVFADVMPRYTGSVSKETIGFLQMPESFKVALNSGIAANLVPYLENLIFGINLMNKQLKEVSKKSGGGDVVDDIF